MKESYRFEDEQTGYRESYDISVSTDGVISIVLIDSDGRVCFPSWLLVERVVDRIREHLDFVEDLREEGGEKDE